jgi:hypothetical protein
MKFAVMAQSPGEKILSRISPPFLEKPFIPTILRESILTLLGPRPHLKTVSAYARIGSMQHIEVQKLALIAYRAKIVAVMNVLEVGVKTAENKPITGTPERDMSVLRKPVAVARQAHRRSSTAAEQCYPARRNRFISRNVITGRM